jgi:[acyl-carrier-protein] S-malonyltransferase
MVTVIGLDPGLVDELCAEARVDGPVVVGLVNGPENTVVSGIPSAVHSVQREAVRAGALRVVPLPTDRAFHSPLMEPLVERWADHVSAMDIASPHTPVVLSTTGDDTSDSQVIRQAMIDQFTHPVRWDRVVKSLARVGVTAGVEVGESKALRSLVRMIEPQIRTFSTLGMSSTTQLCQSVRAELAGAGRARRERRSVEESINHAV